MMKKFTLLLISLITFYSYSQAQIVNYTQRSELNPLFEPFYHGVASGDPLTDGIILWTRVTPRDASTSIEVQWRIAKDSAFNFTMQSGVTQAEASKDYCVKVDVRGLEPNTWYYYEFNAYGVNSLIGRTKTAPSGNVDQLRFAQMSCSNYNTGFFNAYNEVAKRNDIDALLHLGDYIYESGRSGNPNRFIEPEYEILNLGDYRLRHNTHKLDTMSIRMHQQYPLIAVWDDHEVTNNAHRDGADNHTPSTEGNYQDRKSAAQIAYEEWMPIRLPEEGKPSKIWRKISYGGLADIFVLDTRHYDRDAPEAKQNEDPNKLMLGPEQFEWLSNELKISTAQWKVIAQQVMMAPLTPFDITLNRDQWDGYIAERTRFFDLIKNNNIKNVVVLTGDIHTAWAQDLPYTKEDYDPVTGKGSVAVEFVCTSITSTSSPVTIPAWLYNVAKSALPHVKYVDLFKKGYSILDLTAEKTSNDFFSIKTINRPDSVQKFEQSWFVADGEVRLKKQPNATAMVGEPQYQAPPYPRTSVLTPVKEVKYAVIVASYPNPFMNSFQVQFNLFKSNKVTLRMYNMAGALAYEKNLGNLSAGLQIQEINTELLEKGMYRLVVISGDEQIEQGVVKM